MALNSVPLSGRCRWSRQGCPINNRPLSWRSHLPSVAVQSDGALRHSSLARHQTSQPGLEGDGIDTVAKLDAKLAPIRKEIWNGSDLPFPVVMVASRETAVPESESTVRSQAAVDYGVRLYPSTVLISPEGNVLGWFDEEEHVKLFETLPKSH
jgi:hypothetical protein